MASTARSAVPYPLLERVRPMLTAAVLLLLCACRQMTADATQAALRAGFKTAIVQGKTYQHVTFAGGASPAGTPLYVFIEGDGRPWRNNGSRVSSDPTPRNALALELAMRTPRALMYLGRPCYFSARADSACDSSVWTAGRFSAAVVESMAAVVNRHCAANCPSGVVLIGYSGGGVLAVLMAPRVPATVAVVTVAADLDIDAWARWHGYSALAGSLNPATEPPLDIKIAQRHLVGDQDTVAPARLSQRYLDRVSVDYVWHFASFDHVCCWVEQWPDLFARIEAALRPKPNARVEKQDTS